MNILEFTETSVMRLCLSPKGEVTVMLNWDTRRLLLVYFCLLQEKCLLLNDHFAHIANCYLVTFWLPFNPLRSVLFNFNNW